MTRNARWRESLKNAEEALKDVEKAGDAYILAVENIKEIHAEYQDAYTDLSDTQQESEKGEMLSAIADYDVDSLDHNFDIEGIESVILELKELELPA
jgi:hypothetical protein